VTGEIKLDPQAAADTENRLRQSASDISDHGDRLGAGASGTVGRGSLGTVAANLVKKGIDIFVHDVTGVFKKLHTDTADGIKVVRQRMLKAEADSSDASKKLEATLGGVFDRGGGPLTAHVGTGSTDGKVKKFDLVKKPPYSGVTNKFVGKGGSIVEHEDGSVTYISGKGHVTNSSGDPTHVPPGTAVTYGPKGEPDFSKFLTHPSGVKFVTFDKGFAGNTTSDFKDSNDMAAAEAAKNGKPWTTRGQRSPEGYTWHHSTDTKTMYLVEHPIHEFFPHKGGRSILADLAKAASSLGKRKRD